jgi:probable RNA-binding protein EIF1AD
LLLFFFNFFNSFSLTMAGAGRRSNYRKHLTDHVLNDLPIPTSTQRIARIGATRGGNQFDVHVEGKDELALLPTKFHKLVWVKRGDYVIVDKGDESLNEIEGEDSGGFRFMIAHILYKDQIKHIKNEGLWPIEFEDVETDRVDSNANEKEEDSEGEEHESRDGISYDYAEHDEDLFINTNRMAHMKVQDSDSDDSDDE